MKINREAKIELRSGSTKYDVREKMQEGPLALGFNVQSLRGDVFVGEIVAIRHCPFNSAGKEVVTPEQGPSCAPKVHKNEGDGLFLSAVDADEAFRMSMQRTVPSSEATRSS